MATSQSQLDSIAKVRKYLDTGTTPKFATIEEARAFAKDVSNTGSFFNSIGNVGPMNWASGFLAIPESQLTQSHLETSNRELADTFANAQRRYGSSKSQVQTKLSDLASNKANVLAMSGKIGQKDSSGRVWTQADDTEATTQSKALDKQAQGFLDVAPMFGIDLSGQIVQDERGNWISKMDADMNAKVLAAKNGTGS